MFSPNNLFLRIRNNITVAFSYIRLISADLFEVRFGMHRQTIEENDAEQTRKVSKIQIHEDYNPGSIVSGSASIYI